MSGSSDVTRLSTTWDKKLYEKQTISLPKVLQEAKQGGKIRIQDNLFWRGHAKFTSIQETPNVKNEIKGGREVACACECV